MSYVKGHFKKKIFQSQESGYLIGLFKVVEASDDISKLVSQTITFTGYVPDLNEIDVYRLEGNLVTHQKYGEQLEVSNVDRIMPTETDSMIEILSSDMFKGVGKKTAEKIVKVFHEQTFEVILHKSSDLLLVPGITAKQVETLHEAMLAYQGSYEVILSLTSLGFSSRDALKIYHFYKGKTSSVLEEDLYQVYYDILELSFKKIDVIFLNHSNEKGDIKRIQAAFIYVMREITNTFGHTYYQLSEINAYLYRVLGFIVTDEKIEEVLSNLALKQLIVLADEKIYLKDYYDAEICIARRLRLLAHQDKKSIDTFSSLLLEVEDKNQIVYNDEQRLAIQMALENQVLVITGGPGTGKTTIIKAIIDLYAHINHYGHSELMENLALLAPTGRASKRMGQSSALPSSTIHRFLKWNKETNRFQINEYYKSNVNFVIIDEVSMVDTLLLANLLRGLSTKCKIIFVGDKDQLPSVGAGNSLEDMIESEHLPVVELKNLYRQGDGSSIISLAHDMKKGMIDFSIFNQDEELQFIECDDQHIIGNLEKVISNLDEDQFQVLAPMYKTMNGIDVINHHLQELLNKKSLTKKEIANEKITFRENDRVIQLSNMPDDNVFNGDIGIIERVRVLGKKELFVDFDGNVIRYTPAMFSKLSHAYAISIHKSQGSEFPIVVMPITMMYQKMLYRKLIYTGITRSRQKLILIGSKKALQYAVDHNDEQKRRTNLKHFLKNGIL